VPVIDPVCAEAAVASATTTASANMTIFIVFIIHLSEVCVVGVVFARNGGAASGVLAPQTPVEIRKPNCFSDSKQVEGVILRITKDVHLPRNNQR
jgi:hypothetical protein